MGIHGIAKPKRPEPKAKCPQCGRPVVVLKSGKCSYCQAAIDGAPRPAEAHVTLPPELLLALQPRAATISSGSRWTRRVIAVGATALLMAVFMGTCMKVKS